MTCLNLQIDINTLNSLQQIWVWAKEILKNMNAYSDDVIRRSAHSTFGNIVSRQMPLSEFEKANIGNEIQRLAHKIQFYQRWNSASSVGRGRSDAKELYGKIVNALKSKGFYDEQTQREVVESTKVMCVCVIHVVFDELFFKPLV